MLNASIVSINIRYGWNYGGTLEKITSYTGYEIGFLSEIQ
jgi:hypothetical protein